VACGVWRGVGVWCVTWINKYPNTWCQMCVTWLTITANNQVTLNREGGSDFYGHTAICTKKQCIVTKDHVGNELNECEIYMNVYYVIKTHKNYDFLKLVKHKL
jgi:hypothetical protein